MKKLLILSIFLSSCVYRWGYEDNELSPHELCESIVESICSRVTDCGLSREECEVAVRQEFGDCNDWTEDMCESGTWDGEAAAVCADTIDSLTCEEVDRNWPDECEEEFLCQ